MDKTSNKTKKIRKGDTVVAIAGNYRGQSGTVLSTSVKGAVVQGLNVRKKHVKPSSENQRGGIIEIEKPINISNLKVTNPEGEAIKLKVRTNTEGERELFYQKDSKDILYRSLKKS